MPDKDLQRLGRSAKSTRSMPLPDMRDCCYKFAAYLATDSAQSQGRPFLNVIQPHEKFTDLMFVAIIFCWTHCTGEIFCELNKTLVKVFNPRFNSCWLLHTYSELNYSVFLTLKTLRSELKFSFVNASTHFLQKYWSVAPNLINLIYL